VHTARSGPCQSQGRPRRTGEGAETPAASADPPRGRFPVRCDRHLRLLHDRRTPVPQPRSVGHGALRLLDHRDHGVRGRTADDRRGIRPLRRRRRHHQLPRGVDDRLQPAPEPLGRRRPRPRRLAGGRVLQRLSGDEDEDPQLPDHAELVPDAHRHQPGGHQTDHRAGRHPKRLRHGRVRLGEEGVRVLLRGRWGVGADHRAVVAAVHRDRHLGAVQDPDRELDLRRRRQPGLRPRHRPVPVTKVKIGLFMTVGFAAWFVGMHLLFSFNTVQSGQGIGNEFLYIIAAVIGGCLLTGGYGTAIGAAIGAFIFGMTNQGIVYAGWNPDWFNSSSARCCCSRSSPTMPSATTPPRG
ncbi:LOW QUALITY PROTEIN: ABC sugar transporter, partial [Rhodococcus opacus PD630]